jgi:hypothetical protein
MAQDLFYKPVVGRRLGFGNHYAHFPTEMRERRCMSRNILMFVSLETLAINLTRNGSKSSFRDVARERCAGRRDAFW